MINFLMVVEALLNNYCFCFTAYAKLLS